MPNLNLDLAIAARYITDLGLETPLHDSPVDPVESTPPYVTYEVQGGDIEGRSGPTDASGAYNRVYQNSRVIFMAYARTKVAAAEIAGQILDGFPTGYPLNVDSKGDGSAGMLYWRYVDDFHDSLPDEKGHIWTVLYEARHWALESRTPGST